MTREEAFKELTELLPEEFLMEYSEAIRMAIKALSSSEKPNKWIPVSERLPEEKINPITQDYYEYQCTFRSGDIYDVRSYKFGKGHWWLGCGVMDEYVTAWMQLPPPYQSEIPTGQIVANGELYPGEFDDPLAEEGSDKE